MIKAQQFLQLNIPQGYIAGSQDGIVTVYGKPSAIWIYLFDAISLEFVRQTMSLNNGHYIIMGLDPTKQYLLVARDHNKKYEPFAYDYITPATDLTVAEQQQLWQSWQI